MAEPNNTPMPPSTPVVHTPRSTSPAPPLHNLHSPTTLSAALTHASLAPTTRRPSTAPNSKPIVLHIGDPVRYNPSTYAAFTESFEVIRPSTPERQRPEFKRALREGRWGDFAAVFRPFWGSGGEMGRWDEELVGLLPGSCRVFASAGAGFDWADTRALGERGELLRPAPSFRAWILSVIQAEDGHEILTREKGIIYCNSGLAAAEAVADFAAAMVISTFRHLPWCIGAATSRTPSLFSDCHVAATPVSRNLRGQTLGLIGLGNIGQQIAAKLGCAGFGMKIAYFDVIRKDADIEDALGARFCESLEALLGDADCVVLCAPASPDGRPMITEQALASVKPGARFVNVARGSLVDEEALAVALGSGRLSAAAIDVHEEEPRVSERLVKLAGVGDGKGLDGGGTPGRVMLTCHNAGGTLDTHIGFEELSMRNIMAVLGGVEAITPVNLHFLKK